MDEEKLLKLKDLINKLDPDKEVFVKTSESIMEYNEEYVDLDK